MHRVSGKVVGFAESWALGLEMPPVYPEVLSQSLDFSELQFVISNTKLLLNDPCLSRKCIHILINHHTNTVNLTVTCFNVTVLKGKKNSVLSGNLDSTEVILFLYEEIE